MDRLFRHARLKLIDLSAILEKEEVTLAALLAASRPEEAKVLPLFDRVAEARAELEKANARLLLQVILVLTPEQWIMLQSR
jgi:Spy/CpxP family protein refolding chaperone